MTRRIATFVALVSLMLFCQESLAQWIQQTSGTSARLTDIVMLDSVTALCVGDSGKILKTTDAGNAWTEKFSGLQAWSALAFVNSATVFVVGNRMALATTTDGGETWAPWSQSGSSNLLTVACIGMMSLFTGSDSGTIMVSHDGGTTWNPPIRFGMDPINWIFGARGDFLPVWVYGVLPRTALKSSDLGASWTEHSLPITLLYGSALRGVLAPGGTAFIVGYDGQPGPLPVILRRTPLDTTWMRFAFMPPVLPRILRDASAPSSEVAYACGTLGVMFRTTDGGNFWSYHESGTRRNLNAIEFINDQRGFAVGDSGTILFTANGGLTSVDKPTPVPRLFSLSQNYPNPFNPSTTLRYDVPGATHVSLKVYNMLGQEVATLVNEEQQAGYTSVVFAADRLASGVYCYRLAAGTFVAVKKMIVVK